jgi:5-formyltetrahydrofolate cyclo-ligase
MVEDAILNPGPGHRDRNADPRRDLRRALRQRRRDASAAERMAAAEAVASRLLYHPRFPTQGYVAGYWATDGELPLHMLQMRLREGQSWCLPCVQPDGSLRFAPWRPGDPLHTNLYGIPEPDLAPESLLPAQDMAVVVLPLLGFTRQGQRLGMGGGYYDRSLAFRRGSKTPPWLVGAAYSFQELDALAAQDWDVPLDAIATEEEFIEA